MKKFGKFLTTLAVVGAAAAGAYAIYKKFFATEEEPADFDEEFDDEFDEDLCFASEAKRGYVSIPPTEDGETAEVAEAAPAEEPVSETPEV